MSVEEPGTITRWIRALKAGRPEAVEALWRRYYDRVLAVARSRLRPGPLPARQEDEDVALSALYGLADGAARGRFEALGDRSDLWRLLVAITAKKARARRRWYHRWKRSGRPAVGDPPEDPGRPRPASLDEAELLALAASHEPAPEVSAILREQLQRLLDSFTDPTLRRIAEWRMEGLSNAEIASRLGRAVRTVERKVERIRLAWEQIAGEADRRGGSPPP